MAEFTFSGRRNEHILRPAQVSEEALRILETVPFQIDIGNGPADGNDMWVAVPEQVLLDALSALAPADNVRSGS